MVLSPGTCTGYSPDCINGRRDRWRGHLPILCRASSARIPFGATRDRQIEDRMCEGCDKMRAPAQHFHSSGSLRVAQDVVQEADPGAEVGDREAFVVPVHPSLLVHVVRPEWVEPVDDDAE